MSFILARAVDMDIQVVVSLVVTLFLISNIFSFFLQHQQGKYQEVAVSGDLSEGDLKQANATLSAFEVIRLFSLPLSS